MLASSVAGLAAALSIFPGLSIRSAEGCSGASPWVDCGEPAWRSFALVRGDAAVPTDGILLTAVGPAASCANAPDPSALRIAAVAGDVTVAGSVSVVSSAPVTPGYLPSLTAHTLLWKPSAPLAPNASYALHVDAAVLDPGGAAGAAGA
ncbi:MAG TPA: hypothetical protein VFS00_03995, partial [Polyangiaceae bacterium]|nr:hypothetical protein [Polyangiaceae bacterium]